ncbi:hypothetical protein O181_014372 [Austropuccinia psidii MF-1]|uniref:Uncharacterized protein n=1 Tax=Austropuccinia psidii MF-1 TaxID=1389203 RepID=A0A9Q3GPS6_9BASI|nr:hypothetical protein [Austropuccinia psidii MF-1]
MSANTKLGWRGPIALICAEVIGAVTASSDRELSLPPWTSSTMMDGEDSQKLFIRISSTISEQSAPPSDLPTVVVKSSRSS